MDNNLIIDCFFEYEGETIKSHIKEDTIKIHTIDYVEKMSGFLDFYDKFGYSGTEPFYENYEDMTPVKSNIAKKYYERLVARKIKDNKQELN